MVVLIATCLNGEDIGGCIVVRMCVDVYVLGMCVDVYVLGMCADVYALGACCSHTYG